VLEMLEFTSRAVLALVLAGLGTYMVRKSFDLLQRGVITLQQVSPDDAITVEFKRILKFQTRYPAFGFFFIALVCLGMAVWVLPIAPKKPNSIKVTAKLQPHPTGIVTAYFEDTNSQTSQIDTSPGGNIFAEVEPKFVGVRIRIPTPGYEPGEITASLSADKAKGDVLDFGVLSPGIAKAVEKPILDPAQIEK
jgi:hypothetical protein